MKASLLAFAVLALSASASAWYFWGGVVGFGSGNPTYYYQPAPTVIYNAPVYSPYPYYPYPSYYSPYPYYNYAPAYYYSGTYNSYSYSYDYTYRSTGGGNTYEHYHYCCSGSSCGWYC